MFCGTGIVIMSSLCSSYEGLTRETPRGKFSVQSCKEHGDSKHKSLQGKVSKETLLDFSRL